MSWDGANVHMGCGSHPIPGWVNVDGAALPGVDVVLDIHAGLGAVPSDTVAWIYSSHVIEHICPNLLPEVLAHFHRMLRPGGLLTIATIDIDGIYHNWYRTNLNGGVSWNAALYGQTNSTDHPYDAHRQCFNYARLAECFRAAGFRDPRPWTTEKYACIYNLYDFARSCADVTCFCEGVK